MKMKKAGLATKYKLHIRKSVAVDTTYHLSIGTTERILRSSMKAAGITNGNKIIRDNKQAVASLTKEIIETKLEVKSIRSLLERRTSKFEGLSEYDQHFIKAFAREAAISFAEYFSKDKAKSVKLEKLIVYLSDDGDLYLDLKKKHCYRMGKDSLRQQIVRILISSNSYVPPEALVQSTDSTKKSVEFAINRINSLTKSHLKSIKLIDNRRTHGYRINPDITIKRT